MLAEVFDSSGYRVEVNVSDAGVVVDGHGPRGGRLGSIVLDSQAMSADFARALRELAASMYAGRRNGNIATWAPVIAVVIPRGLADPSAQMAWIYPDNAPGGHRRPIELHDAATLEKLADAVAEIADVPS
jgi:hypothetical protein